MTRHDDEDAGEQAGGKEGGDFFFVEPERKNVTFSLKEKKGKT